MEQLVGTQIIAVWGFFNNDIDCAMRDEMLESWDKFMLHPTNRMRSKLIGIVNACTFWVIFGKPFRPLGSPQTYLMYLPTYLVIVKLHYVVVRSSAVHGKQSEHCLTVP